MQTLVTVLLASTVLSLLAVAMGYILGWANQAFHVEVDPKIEALNEVLPGANCGGCGYVGCGEYAEAVAEGEELTLCGPGGAGCISAMAEIMGVKAGEVIRLKAVVHCGATTAQRHGRHKYHGEQTCASASLVSHFQGCVYGCLGLGDCVEVCDDDAIHVIDGVAVVNDLCTSCKACVKACPKEIISMLPFKIEDLLAVRCSSQDMGKEVKEVCDVGCTGCKACTRKNDLLIMDGNLAVVDYDAYDTEANYGDILKKCRTNTIVFIGEPRNFDKESAEVESS